jgi:hypothetical protein
MSFTLEGLRDLERIIIDKRRQVEDIDIALNKELVLLQQLIQSYMGGSDTKLVPYVRLDLGDKMVYLEYNMGDGKVTARDYHNPGSPKFKGSQPFQQALEAMGYENIEPGFGQAIPVSSGSAPGIRLKARMSDEVINRLMRNQ